MADELSLRNAYRRGEVAPGDGRHVLVAAMPKSGSSLLIRMVAELPGFTRIAVVRGHDRRENELALDPLIGGHGRDWVAQAHVRNSTTTARMRRTFSLRTVVQTRDLADALVSVHDHLLNIATVNPIAYVPDAFGGWPRERRLAFVVDTFAPWYLHFFLSWRGSRTSCASTTASSSATRRRSWRASPRTPTSTRPRTRSAQHASARSVRRSPRATRSSGAAAASCRRMRADAWSSWRATTAARTWAPSVSSLHRTLGRLGRGDPVLAHVRADDSRRRVGVRARATERLELRVGLPTLVDVHAFRVERVGGDDEVETARRVRAWATTAAQSLT